MLLRGRVRGKKELSTSQDQLPVNDEFGKRTSASEGSSKTPLLLWLISFTSVIVIYGLRVPQAVLKARAQVPEESAANENPAIVDFGVVIGGYLFIIIMSFDTIIYYGVAVVLNKYLYPSGFLTWGKCTIGYFFLLAALATVVPQALTSLCGLMKPQDLPLFWGIPVVATGFTAFLYRQCWAGVSRGKKAMVALISFGFAILPLI